MATNYYVDPDDGDDAWDGSVMVHTEGTIGPKETLGGALALITGPITDETTIHLQINTTNDYEGDCELQGVYCVGEDAELIIQPYGWDDDKYEDMSDDPYCDGGSCSCRWRRNSFNRRRIIGGTVNL